MFRQIVFDDDLFLLLGVGTVRFHDQQFSLFEFILADAFVDAAYLVGVVCDFKLLLQSLPHLD
jgi:hypothetical protein